MVGVVLNRSDAVHRYVRLRLRIQPNRSTVDIAP